MNNCMIGSGFILAILVFHAALGCRQPLLMSKKAALLSTSDLWRSTNQQRVFLWFFSLARSRFFARLD